MIDAMMQLPLFLIITPSTHYSKERGLQAPYPARVVSRIFVMNLTANERVGDELDAEETPFVYHLNKYQKGY